MERAVRAFKTDPSKDIKAKGPGDIWAEQRAFKEMRQRLLQALRLNHPRVLRAVAFTPSPFQGQSRLKPQHTAEVLRFCFLRITHLSERLFRISNRTLSVLRLPVLFEPPANATLAACAVSYSLAASILVSPSTATNAMHPAESSASFLRGPASSLHVWQAVKASRRVLRSDDAAQCQAG
jgi:hypothetical protein